MRTVALPLTGNGSSSGVNPNSSGINPDATSIGGMTLIDGAADLTVKFRRSEVINLLPPGEKVPVRVTGVVGATTFEGMDIIRVIP